MILELLAQYPQINSMVDAAILVMPSIDHMAETEVGKKVTRLFTYAYYPLIGLSYLLDTFLPEAAQKALVRYVLRKDTSALYGSTENSKTIASSSTIPDCVLRSGTNLIHPPCLRALVHMTICEFAQVLEPNLEAIEANRGKLTILYGEADHWAPVPYYQRLRQRASPEVDMRLCLGTMDHAFVVDRAATEKVAQLTVFILKDKLKIK